MKATLIHLLAEWLRLCFVLTLLLPVFALIRGQFDWSYLVVGLVGGTVFCLLGAKAADWDERTKRAERDAWRERMDREYDERKENRA